MGSDKGDIVARIGVRTLQLNVLPDWLVRAGIRHMLASRIKEVTLPTREQQMECFLAFVESLKQMPITIDAVDSKTQHYEVPTEFFKLVLVKHVKYSPAYFAAPSSSLDEAEEAMLELYCVRAQLEDNKRVLDLGCGWGALSLYIAAKYPSSRVVGVSHSATQKQHIDGEIRRRGLSNVEIVTCDVNTFDPGRRAFDRILSIGMFEHVKNFQKLLRNCASWLEDDGMLFIEHFAHKFIEVKGKTDWMAQKFFTGGTMMAGPLLLYFQDDMVVQSRWAVNGKHYSRTCEEWLKKMDANLPEIKRLFAATYGKEVKARIVNWRTALIAFAELFGYNNEEDWDISQYLLKKR